MRTRSVLQRVAYIGKFVQCCLFGAVLALASASCADPSALHPNSPAIETVLSRVSTSPAALVLAVGDTISVKASATNIFGESISMDSGSRIVWKTSAAQTISVDSNGLVQAHKATAEDQSINITATWTHNGVTLTATTYATVTATRAPVAGIRIIPTDSTRSGWSNSFESIVVNGKSSYLAAGASVYTVDANDVPMSTQTIRLALQDTALRNTICLVGYGKLGIMLGIGQYQIMCHFVGNFWIEAEATVYGVPMRDSIEWTGLYPVTALVPITRDSTTGAFLSTMNGHEVFAQPCGLVRFQNSTNVPIDIVFSDSTAAAQCITTDEVSNVRNLGVNKTATRKFPATGTVQWYVHDPNTGAVIPHLSGKVTTKTP